MATLKQDQHMILKTNDCLIQVKSIAECSTGAFYNTLTFIKLAFVIKILFCLYLSDRFTQVLL